MAALLTAPTQAAAAAQAGIGEATLQRWLRLPEFQLAYRQARQQLLDRAVGKLLAACSLAVDTLREQLQTVRSTDRIKAALGILNQAIRGAELLDLAERVSELERQHKQRPKSGRAQEP